MPMNAISILPKVALSQLHSIYHIDKYRFTICAIFLVIMLDTMCSHAYILAAMAGSIFTASCICAIASTSCILAGAFHLHHEYACHIFSSSFYLFLGGGHVGASSTYSHIRTSYYSCMHYLHRHHLLILTCLNYHLWWYVFYGIVKLKAV